MKLIIVSWRKRNIHAYRLTWEASESRSGKDRPRWHETRAAQVPCNWAGQERLFLTWCIYQILLCFWYYIVGFLQQPYSHFRVGQTKYQIDELNLAYMYNWQDVGLPVQEMQVRSLGWEDPLE